MITFYLKRFAFRVPPVHAATSRQRQAIWSTLAGLSIGLGARYIYWRWAESLNPEALAFSIAVASAESLSFIAMLLFYYDIWSEGDTPLGSPPDNREDVCLLGSGPVTVDILITTFDEAADLVALSVTAAQSLDLPDNVTTQVWLCDDGNRREMAQLAWLAGVGYLNRKDNRGYKAGNLRNAIFKTKGDFIVICDADTRLLPTFVTNTIGYFRDPKVAWVQTPHWFYDIPSGESWARTLLRFGRRVAVAAPLLRALTGTRQFASDPFLADSSLFFDVIQRRRNRNGAAFCCGAGSIHRREAVLQGALQRSSRAIATLGKSTAAPWRRIFDRKVAVSLPTPFALSIVDLQPFTHHVSEDLLTSIQLHSDALASWRSVYHPQVESRMLSVCSIAAWSIQRLKYAEGTYDIMFRHNPLLRYGMPWRIKLHYASTFCSYLSAIWMPILLFAPAISLAFGFSPVKSYSAEFFFYLLPVIFANEAALLSVCKGSDFHQGRLLSVTSLPLQWRALFSVCQGRRPKFPVTPKTIERGGFLAFLWPNLLILAFFIIAACAGLIRYSLHPGESLGPLVTNLFWLMTNALAIGCLIPACFWAPKFASKSQGSVASRKSLS